jgi:GAF domain-containing protein
MKTIAEIKAELYEIAIDLKQAQLLDRWFNDHTVQLNTARTIDKFNFRDVVVPEALADLYRKEMIRQLADGAEHEGLVFHQKVDSERNELHTATLFVLGGRK